MATKPLTNINNYELLNQIGAGNYGTVHKAFDKQNKKCVAIKIMSRQRVLRGKTTINNLISEIQLMKKLQHKNIVKMEDFCWDQQNIYIIMELCEAGNLSSFIHKRSVLAESTCRIFIRMLAEAMKYLRDNNVSHLDLKPQNLLLTRPTPSSMYILKICDFGFAQDLAIDEENDSVKGSPLYMAPEIILKQKYDAKADLWSIGVILYECLFGKAPYSSKTLQELLDKVNSLQKIQMPLNSKVSKECEDLLFRLLQHSAEQRISFKDFFNHEFIDLKHAPSDENLEKAIEIVTRAVEEDNNQNYLKAYHLYCEGLTYFVPLIEAESGTKKVALRSRSQSYLQRAEHIKLNILNPTRQQNEQNEEDFTDAPVEEPIAAQASTSQNNCRIKNAIAPSPSFHSLYKMCASSPKLQNGLEIGQQAEFYTFEKKLDLSLVNYKRALSYLVPLLSEEPKGERKDLLHGQICNWMKEAESIKSILVAQLNISDSSDDGSSSDSSRCIIA
ncbi:unnamed protein product [Diamesa serratosioi]